MDHNPYFVQFSPKMICEDPPFTEYIDGIEATLYRAITLHNGSVDREELNDDLLKELYDHIFGNLELHKYLINAPDDKDGFEPFDYVFARLADRENKQHTYNDPKDDLYYLERLCVDYPDVDYPTASFVITKMDYPDLHKITIRNHVYYKYQKHYYKHSTGTGQLIIFARDLGIFLCRALYFSYKNRD